MFLLSKNKDPVSWKPSCYTVSQFSFQNLATSDPSERGLAPGEDQIKHLNSIVLGQMYFNLLLLLDWKSQVSIDTLSLDMVLCGGRP